MQNAFVLRASLVCFVLSSALSRAEVVVRAAIDMGSASTKVRIAQVDSDSQKTVKVLLDKKSFVLPFEEERKASGEKNRIPESLLVKAAEALEVVKAEGEALRAGMPIQYSVVATSAFRKAQNGLEFAKILSEKSGMPIQVITQQDEALLGFYAAVSTYPEISPDEMVVWDIGGGSTQLTWRENGQFQIIGGDFASIAMKRFVLEEIKKTPQAKSPNPLGVEAAEGARKKAAQQWAALIYTDSARQAIRSSTLIGVGPVHAISVQDQTRFKQTLYTREDAAKALETRLHLDDSQLALANDPALQSEIAELPIASREARVKKSQAYVDTDATNLALVLGFLDGLNLEEVKTANTSLNEGLLIAPQYWK